MAEVEKKKGELPAKLRPVGCLDVLAVVEWWEAFSIAVPAGYDFINLASSLTIDLS